MRSLILAGAALAAFATSANAWTQSILHPEQSYKSDFATAFPVTPRYMAAGPQAVRGIPEFRLQPASSSPTVARDGYAGQRSHR
ncbi:hypothetical protein [Methylobacterium nodulans]|uniref:Uncharacterized protein n=1 Tax=Methylobacterium nodulans (strain LMG 21967 / CNCM I-2342 / ORS 2060) TaxID=460265 RepID=B8IX32_METNO|nr:hypothetical protein [Methylobacterium nodulans]ACL63073.1 hypothetical protein Mnod_8086 [Methylobacterium nodulans ORS 2060]